MINNVTTNNFHPPATQNRANDSAIIRVLTGLYDLVIKNNSTFSPIDTRPYTINEKILHNQLTKYKSDYDYYMDGHLQVSEKLGVISENEPTVITKLDAYVTNLYRTSKREMGISPDAIVDNIVAKITKDLNGHANLTFEEKSAIPIVVFDVFARCKIFEKPPSPMGS